MEKRLARREKSRVLWIDGVRFLAFGVVFTRHYFESFFPENIPEVRGGISAFLWRGITGKAAVSMFCVLLGYFVAASVKKYAFSEYTIRRYLYFMTHLLVVKSLRLCALFFLRFGNQRWEVYLYGRLWTSSFCGNGFLAIAFSFHTIWFPLFGVWPIFFWPLF